MDNAMQQQQSVDGVGGKKKANKRMSLFARLANFPNRN
jgi:hypothetical protein